LYNYLFYGDGQPKIFTSPALLTEQSDNLIMGFSYSSVPGHYPIHWLIYVYTFFLNYFGFIVLFVHLYKLRLVLNWCHNSQMYPNLGSHCVNWNDICGEGSLNEHHLLLLHMYLCEDKRFFPLVYWWNTFYYVITI